jgi:hypothetical protein
LNISPEQDNKRLIGDSKMFKVMYWENQFEKGQFPESHEEYIRLQTHSTHEELKDAKKVCRELGHTGENNVMLTGYPPIAFVADSENEVVYNPRFKK